MTSIEPRPRKPRDSGVNVDELAAQIAGSLAPRIVFRRDKFRIRGGRGWGKPIPIGFLVALVAESLPTDLNNLQREMLARVVVSGATFREGLR